VDHPIVGVWSIEIVVEGRPRRELATSAFHPDGSMTVTSSDYAAQGPWTAVSPRVARFRAMAPLGPAEGQPGWQTLEANVVTSDDGRSLSLQGAHSRPTPSGELRRTGIRGSGERLLT
jgi:hypothetical protein